MAAEKDVESGRPARIPWTKQILDQGVVNDDIVNAYYEGAGTNEDPYIVQWLDDDPRNPMNYPTMVKWAITMLVAVATLAVAFVSSAYSGGVREIMVEFGVVQIIATLGISLFVLGFAIGPLIWAPMSGELTFPDVESSETSADSPQNSSAASTSSSAPTCCSPPSTLAPPARRTLAL